MGEKMLQRTNDIVVMWPLPVKEEMVQCSINP